MSTFAADILTPPRRPGFFDRLRAVAARHETIRFLVESQLKAGHRDKLLGHIWNILDPLLLMGVYFFVFGVALRLGGDNPVEFLAYLFIGVIFWRFLDATLSQATIVIRGSRGLIHEIHFPRSILPLAVVFARLYDLLWGMVVLFLTLLIAPLFLGGFSVPWSPLLAWLPVLLVLQVLFVAGLTLIIAYVGAFFADTANIVSVAIRIWFYASPIFYHVTGPHARIPEWLRPWYLLNPMAAFLESYRAILLYGQPPVNIGYLALVALLSFLVGFAIFTRGEGAFVKYV